MKVIADLLIMTVIIMVSNKAFAFDMDSIIYKHSSNQENSVNITFHGKVFNPPLDILKTNGEVEDKEYRRFHEFFKRLYDMNIDGSQESILSLWSTKDHADVKNLMSQAALKQNKARFKAVSAMKLNMVIQYGEYFICFVELRFQGQQPIVMKYPVAEEKGFLKLSNSINGDYFYAIISQYLDDTNFMPLLNP